MRVLRSKRKHDAGRPAAPRRAHPADRPAPQGRSAAEPAPRPPGASGSAAAPPGETSADGGPPAEGRVRAEDRMRASVCPDDRALYTCVCGYVFDADVTASVACPRCGATQAW